MEVTIVVLMTLIIVVWIVCGVLSYGLEFAYWQRRFPELAEEDYRVDMTNSMVTGLLGPVGLLLQLLMGGTKYGIKFK